MKLSNNVEMLEITSARGTIYPVLLWDQDNVVLVDTGHPMQIDLIRQAVEKAGFSLNQINKIIFTHQDIDHIGCAKELIAESPNIETFAYKDEVAYIDGCKTPVKLAGMEANFEHLTEDAKGFYHQYKAAFENRHIKIDKALTDGEVLPICGGIEVIHTPGHTPGHICLLLQDSHILIGGDALNIESGKLIGSNPQYTSDMQLALHSIKKLINCPIKTVITYHCGEFKGDVQKALSEIAKGI